jgi:anti-sigma-K factor RskA
MTRSGTPRASAPRAHDLLADRALHGLDDADARELRALGADTDDSYDLAAAAVDLATIPIEPMPAAVAERVLAARKPRTLTGWVMPAGLAAPFGPMQPGMTPPDMPPPGRTPPGMTPPGMTPPGMTPPGPMTPRGLLTPSGPGLPSGPTTPPVGTLPSGLTAPSEAPPRSVAAASSARRRRRSAVVWFATAASLLAIAGVSWWLVRGRAAPTAAAARADLLASAADVAQLAWQPKEASAASGDVVWSPSAQRGFMRFVGLPPNDPTKTQYQLWIFDRRRDQAFPVDGGVFDATSTGEVIIPITAKLHVDDATLFAVTVERPGGVVVSKREHIAVIAARS